jgi:hypothetical protein
MFKLSLRMSLSALCLLASAVAVHAQQADVRAQFLASNPNNGWEYGFINGDGDFVRYNSTFDDHHGIAGWCLNKTPGPRGAVAMNYLNHTIDRYDLTWQPGGMCVRPPLDGQTVVISWHALASTIVTLSVSVKAVTPATDVDAGIYLNDSLLDGNSVCNIVDSPFYSSEFVSSKMLNVSSGGCISLRISSAEGQPCGHVGIFIQVSPIGAIGSTTIGAKPFVKQVLSFEPMWQSAPSLDLLLSGRS